MGAQNAMGDFRFAMGCVIIRLRGFAISLTSYEAGMDMRIDTVRTDGFTMDYCRFGHGKESLVILPGMSVQRVMGLADAIEAAYSPLADDFTIYVLERRNAMPLPYPVRDMARDTARAMQALGLGPACLFGASQGGMMALCVALEHPELVRRLVLGSASARVTEARYRQVFGRWAALARAGDAAALYLVFGAAVYPPDVFEGSRQLLLDAAKDVSDEDLSRFAAMAEGMRGFDITDELRSIACPTLVLGAEDDSVLGGEASRQIAARLESCELHMYAGYGHAAYDLAPDYRERMLRFLRGTTH